MRPRRRWRHAPVPVGPGRLSEFDGQTEVFYYDITRQFIVGPGEDDDITQLSLIFEFSLDPVFQMIESGQLWCERPDQSDELRQFIGKHPSTLAVAERAGYRVILDYDQIG